MAGPGVGDVRLSLETGHTRFSVRSGPGQKDTSAAALLVHLERLITPLREQLQRAADRDAEQKKAPVPAATGRGRVRNTSEKS